MRWVWNEMAFKVPASLHSHSEAEVRHSEMEQEPQLSPGLQSCVTQEPPSHLWVALSSLPSCPHSASCSPGSGFPRVCWSLEESQDHCLVFYGAHIPISSGFVPGDFIEGGRN